MCLSSFICDNKYIKLKGSYRMNEQQEKQIVDVIYELSDSFTKEDFIQHHGKEFESVMFAIAKEEEPSRFEDGEDMTLDDFDIAITIDKSYKVIAEDYVEMNDGEVVIDATHIKTFMLSQDYFAFTILFGETIEEYKEEYPTPKYMEDVIATYITDESVNELVQSLSPEWIYEDAQKVDEACREIGMTEDEIRMLDDLHLPLEVTNVKISKPLGELSSHAYEEMPTSSTCTEYVQDDVMSQVINNNWFDYQVVVPTRVVEIIKERIAEDEDDY